MASTKSFQPIREVLTLVLIVLLPLHALFVTVSTLVLLGANHAPWGLLAVWKEALLAFICAIAAVEIFQHAKATSYKPRATSHKLDLIILLFLATAFTVSFFQQSSLAAFLLGLRYDCIPLLAFLILRRAPWSVTFWRRVEKLLIGLGVAVTVYGFFTLYLPQPFFTWLGYSDLHSLYLPHAPIAAFQQLAGSALRRMQSSLSGPNQLGAWLLLPYAVLLWRLREPGNRRLYFVYLSVVILGIAAALSRAAWLGAGIMTISMLFTFIPKVFFARWFSFFLCTFTCAVLIVFLLFPSVLVRLSSTRGHWEQPLKAIHMIIQNPLGLGLGSVGPASSRESDACVHLQPQDDPTWARTQPNLCVFLGSEQVQPSPTTKSCNCPFHPENWYLQIGLETGVLGMVLYLVILCMLLFALWPRERWLALAFLGVCTMSLFLHAWADASVAYVLFVLAAVLLRQQSSQG